MTQDEIIEMAQECNLIGMRPHLDGIYSEALVAFAHLVAAKEREACAQVAFSWNHEITDKVAEEIRARGEQALAQLKQDGDCKKCKDGCPACDARKLQKEAHDLL